MDKVRLEELQFDEQGLIPVAVTEQSTNELLMLAYMSRESLQESITTGQAVFYSRSRKELWHKGKTSGNFLRLVDIKVNCYANSLQVAVEILGDGVACHTSHKSCFYRGLEY